MTTKLKPRPVRNGVGASAITMPNSGPWRTVFDYLKEKFPTIAADEWQSRFEQNVILDRDGAPITVDYPFRGQARIYYFRDLKHEVPVPFEAPIVFQDEHLVVADKPHFLSVLPAGRYVQETLLVRLKRATGIDTLSPMHRIDRETAGLVVFVVQPQTRGAYQSMFHTHAISKTYEAIAPKREDLNFPLRFSCRLEESANFMQMARVDGEPNSETVIELMGHDASQGLGHYRLTPITGKKHQLRAHLNALGMPIVNDSIYPVHQPAAADDFSKPLQLLAKSIAFEDPITGLKREFESKRRLAFGWSC